MMFAWKIYWLNQGVTSIGLHWVNLLAPGRLDCNAECAIFKLISVTDILSICEIHKMTSQHWFRSWLDAVRQQAMTWTKVGQIIWHLMASPGDNELKQKGCNSSAFAYELCSFWINPFNLMDHK